MSIPEVWVHTPTFAHDNWLCTTELAQYKDPEEDKMRALLAIQQCGVTNAYRAFLKEDIVVAETVGWLPYAQLAHAAFRDIPHPDLPSLTRQVMFRQQYQKSFHNMTNALLFASNGAVDDSIQQELVTRTIDTVLAHSFFYLR